MKRDQQKDISDLVIEKEEIEKTHANCRAEIIKLNDKIAQLEIQARNQKKAKNEIKVEPIYIEKPVHVEKIVEKIVPV
jgi:tRNA A37 threonylcarbamoyladenosine modification protein TsaB